MLFIFPFYNLLFFTPKLLMSYIISTMQGPCMDALPKLYLDIHNACVMKKLSMFISTPKCGRLLRVTALKKKVRNLYNIMNTFCRRDLVFFTDDCDALEPHLLASTITPVFSR
ncbi:cytokine-like protein 1 isoform X3 [Ascaphus truei]|uniref:cytokine-like protein 1 isoform X3 n=1 Tax=Ascaphus truei TaxID=8439 RepID=UPI003F59B165